uniref:NADH-ubiquinone oxidoreductase chain 4L n=1 Tax=Paramastax nigra TaxID=1260743 RepID=M4JCB2_9ORTH|nr:NADH dehydrogenase subunit 4L [Paramastax nigra]
MFSLSIMILFFIYFSGLYVFCFMRNHLLLVLLSLGYMVISLFFMIILYLSLYNYILYFVIFYLVISVCEGALALSILVSMIRCYGNDFFGSFSLSLC